MKKLFSILVLCAVALFAEAQFVTSPNYGLALSNQTGVYFLGNALVTSNLPNAQTRIIPIGPSGSVQLWATVTSTNALTVTNSAIVFSLIGPNVTNNFDQTFQWSMIPGGAGTVRLTTNFTPHYLAAQANESLGNAFGLRIKSIANGNNESIYITNIYWSTR